MPHVAPSFIVIIVVRSLVGLARRTAGPGFIVRGACHIWAHKYPHVLRRPCSAGTSGRTKRFHSLPRVDEIALQIYQDIHRDFSILSILSRRRCLLRSLHRSRTCLVESFRGICDLPYRRFGRVTHIVI